MHTRSLVPSSICHDRHPGGRSIGGASNCQHGDSVAAVRHIDSFATGFGALLCLLALEGLLMLSLRDWNPAFAWSGYAIVFIAGFATAWRARSRQPLQVSLLGLVAEIMLPAASALWRALGAPLDNLGYLAEAGLGLPFVLLSAWLGGVVAMLVRGNGVR